MVINVFYTCSSEATKEATTYGIIGDTFSFYGVIELVIIVVTVRNFSWKAILTRYEVFLKWIFPHDIILDIFGSTATMDYTTASNDITIFIRNLSEKDKAIIFEIVIGAFVFVNFITIAAYNNLL